jgi:hypothetical protein
MLFESHKVALSFEHIIGADLYEELPSIKHPPN